MTFENAIDGARVRLVAELERRFISPAVVRHHAGGRAPLWMPHDVILVLAALIGRGVAVEKPLLEKRNEKNLYPHARRRRAKKMLAVVEGEATPLPPYPPSGQRVDPTPLPRLPPPWAE